jgi:hypothetical protein
MSSSSITGSLPAVNPALEPASVRNGTPAAKQAYQEALGFEQVLVNQLAQEMVSSISGSGDTSGGSDATGSGDASANSDAASSQYSQLLPGALTSGIMSAGGLGIAAQLATALDPSLKATS